MASLKRRLGADMENTTSSLPGTLTVPEWENENVNGSDSKKDASSESKHLTWWTSRWKLGTNVLK